MISNNRIRAQGRTLSAGELVAVQNLIDEHPDWSRHRVAKELCQRWEWRTPVGKLKTFAARSLLLKLAERRQVELPPVRPECRHQRQEGTRARLAFTARLRRGERPLLAPRCGP